MVSTAILAATPNSDVAAGFQLMQRYIHRFDVKSQELRNPPLTDPDRGALVGVPCQHPVNAARGHRQAMVKKNGLRHPSIFLGIALFGFSVHFLFGFSVHVI